MSEQRGGVGEWVFEVARAAIRDLPEENVWEHAAREIFLGGHQSLVHRFFDPELTPYTKLFQEAATGQFSKVPEEDWWLQGLLARGQRVDEFFAIKSSQSGFTQAAINIIVFVTRFLSGRGLYCIDSRDKAGKLCRLRLLPLFEKLCAAQLSNDQDALGTYLIELANWVWEMVGSYSSGVFSEKALTHAFLDDVVYMVTEGGKSGMLDEVHIIDHARSRFTTADEHFLAVFSKPDLEEDYFISEWRGGSQHAWNVPCWYCNRGVVLELEHLHYDKVECRDLLGHYDLDAVEALTTARCPLCTKDLEEKWKAPMNAAGVYLPKSKEQRLADKDPLLAPRRLSVRVNDMVSPFAEVKWGRLARLMISAEDNPERKKFVQTNHGARAWKEGAVNLKAEQVKALCAGWKDPETGYVHGVVVRGAGSTSNAGDGTGGVLGGAGGDGTGIVHAGGPPAATGQRPVLPDAGEFVDVRRYLRGECPFVPDAVIATADRQGDKKKWVLCGWRVDGSWAVIEYGATLADQGLLDLSENPRAHHGGGLVCLADPSVFLHAGYGMDSGGCLIDSGFETTEVYDFCIASGWRWYPSKGVGGLDLNGYMTEAKNDHYNGGQIMRYHYHDYKVKVMLYSANIARHTHADPKIRKRAKLFLPADVGDDFVTELISESLQPDKKTKRMVWVHDKSVGPNDWGDAMKMQLVMWQFVGPQLVEAARARELARVGG